MSTTAKIALVTGGAIRVGRAILTELDAAGYRLAIHYHGSRADAAEQQQRFAGATLHRADLRDLGQIEALAEEVVGQHGRVDVLIHNAALYYPTPVGQTSGEQWDDLHHLNLRAPYFLTQALRPAIPAGGVIVNITDAGGTVPAPDHIPYGVTKAGLVAMTEGLARALAPDIRVNAVAPGPVILPERYDAAQRAASIAETLLQREGAPADIARAVRFLVENDYITGAVLPVDGGRRLV